MTDSQADFQEFLKQKKIDLSGLQGSGTVNEAFDLDRQKLKHILLQRMQAFPITQQEHYRMDVDFLVHTTEKLNDACFSVCGQEDRQLTYLDYDEGLCFRNCMSKFGSFLPTVKNSLKQTAGHHTIEKADRLSENKHAQLIKDPFAEEKDRLIAKIFPHDRSGI